MVTTRAAICFEVGGDWEVREIELDPPKEMRLPVAALVLAAVEAVLLGNRPVELGRREDLRTDPPTVLAKKCDVS